MTREQQAAHHDRMMQLHYDLADINRDNGYFDDADAYRRIGDEHARMSRHYRETTR